MRWADGIIIGSPTYFSNLSTEVKALIDRAGLLAIANGYALKRKVGAEGKFILRRLRRPGRAHQAIRKLSRPMPNQIRELNAQWSEVRSERNKLLNDKEVREERLTDQLIFDHGPPSADIVFDILWRTSANPAATMQSVPASVKEAA